MLALTSNVEYGQARLGMQEETIKDLVSSCPCQCDARGTRGASCGQLNCWLTAGFEMFEVNCAASDRYFQNMSHMSGVSGKWPISRPHKLCKFSQSDGPGPARNSKIERPFAAL